MVAYLELSERRGPFTLEDVRLSRFPGEFICEALMQDGFIFTVKVIICLCKIS